MNRTEDPQIFLTARQGEDFAYDIPLQPGFYELRLYFAETLYGDDNSEDGGESNRIFDVTANGQPLLVNFDPVLDAGGSNTAHVRVFARVSPGSDGKLHLRFHNSQTLKGVAFVNAIQLTRTEVMLPIRWVASNSAVEDRHGHLWIPDQFVQGGRRRQLRVDIQGTTDPKLYQFERFGNFSYHVPVADNATYTVTLHFTEHSFGVTGMEDRRTG
jgi:Malectin domain